MAEIGASINLQVKGTSRLDRLINSASQLDSIVKELNKNPIELSTQKAASNLDKFDAELKALQISIGKSEKGIDSAGNAINEYATQIASLQTKLNQLNPNTVAYNKVLDRQQKAIRSLAQAQGDLSKAQKDLESSQGKLFGAERNVSSARTAKLAAEALNGLADSYIKVKSSQKGTEAGATKKPLLESSISQINSQADALKLVAANAKIASSEFNRFSIASQAASQELFTARQRQLSAVAFGLSGSAPSVNLGRGGNNAALATRNQVQDLVNLYPQIVKSEAGLSAYGDELRRIQSLVPYASEEFRKLENVLAELNQEISEIGLRGQRSAITLPQPIRALGPTSPVEGTLKQRQQYAEAVNKQYQKQLDLSDKIDRSAIGVADKEALSLQLNQALDALGENRLEDAQKMTIEINRQVSAMSRLQKTGGTQIIGALGTGFSPISGRMPSGEIVPGSPADKGRQAKAKLSWQSALAQMSVVASELEDTAKARGAKIQMDWNLAFEKAKDIISDATLAGLQEGTKAAVSLGQQQIREMERSTAKMWREFGGPALPPGFGAGGRAGGTYRTGEFSPMGGARRLTSALASGAIVEQSLLNLQGKGVNVADRLVQLQNALNTAKQDTFEISIKSLDALSDEVALAGKYAQLQRQILAGQGAGGRGGASKESGFRPALTSAEVKAQINEIVTDFNAVAPKAGSAGDNIASTFATELKQGASSAAAAAKTFAAAALEAIKDVFGIASPSRVMKEIAENLVSSFITELVSNIPSVKVALEQTFGAKGGEYEQPGRARTRGPSLRMEGDPRFFAALSGEPLSAGRPSPAGIFPAATPRVGAPGSGFPFQTYGMARTQFPSDVPAALKAPRNQLSDTSAAVSEAIKEYRVAINNFWEGEDSQFEAITKILTSSARLGAARLARRLQQGPDLTQAERIVEEARTIAASQRRGTFARISDVVTGDTRLGISSAVASTYQRISDSLLNSLEALGFTVSDNFKDAIDRVRNAVPSVLGGIGGILPPGGFGGGRRGGGGGGAAGAGGPQNIEDLQRSLGLRDLGPIARATGEQIDELTARLTELRQRIDPTTQDFRELTQQLGVLGREQERRAPEAEFLTRRFGPRGGRAVSEGLIGGAFPLLFGQGIGAAAGGGIGGALGGFAGGGLGFGLSLIGTALGTAFDTATQSARDFNTALEDTGDATGALETALGRVDKGTKTLIQNLAESGQQAAAAEASFDALAQKIGIEQAEAFQRSGRVAADWGATIQTQLTKLYANAILLAEAIARIFPQRQTSVFDIVEAQPEQPLAQSARDRIEDLAGQNNLLEKQVALSRLTSDASIEQRLQLERQVALQEYVNEAVELERQLKQSLLSDQEYNLRLRAAELNLAKELYSFENAAAQERDRRAREAQQEAERAAKQQEQTIRNILGLQAELVQVGLAGADIDIAAARLKGGEAAGIQEELAQLQRRLDYEARILDIELQQKLTSSEVSAQEKNLLEAIYREQIKSLTAQYNIRQATLLQAEAQLLLEKFISAEQAKAQAIAPFEQFRQAQELDAQFAKTYYRLLVEGIAPTEAERLANFERLVAEQLTAIDQQIVLTSAALAQAEAYGVSADEIKKLRDELENLNKARGAVTEEAARGPGAAKEEIPGEKIQEFISTAEQELKDLESVAIRVSQGIGDAVGNSLSNGIAGLIEGTKTAKEVFADFLKDVGQTLAQEGAKMIATYIAIGIARIFAGFLSAGGGGGEVPGALGKATNTGLDTGAGNISDMLSGLAAKGAYFSSGQADFAQNSIQPFATGGIVSSPTLFQFADGGIPRNGLMGEAGPEAIMPLKRGADGKLGVAAKLDGAMGRYRRSPGSAGGSAGGGATTEIAAGGVATMEPIDVRYSVERINNVDYVTADQFQRGMAQAARQGAIQGERSAMRTLGSSPAARRRLGI